MYFINRDRLTHSTVVFLYDIFGAVCPCDHSCIAPQMCGKRSCFPRNVMYYLLIKQKYITKIIWILLIPVQDWYIWVIDQVWGQDGRISAMFFFLHVLWTETESRSMNRQKNEWGQYPVILTEKAWSIKDLLYGFRGNFSCGTRREVPSWQDSSILPTRVANHSAGFDSSCPLTELAM